MAQAAKKHRRSPADDRSDAFAAALAEYKAVGLAVIPNMAPSTTFGAAALRAFLAEHDAACQVGWCHESGAAVPSPRAFLDLETSVAGDQAKGKGAPAQTQPKKRSRSGGGEGATVGNKRIAGAGAEASTHYYASFVVNGGAVLTDLLSRLPFGDAPSALAAVATHAPRAWCFAGRNHGSVSVAGRAEHTDDVLQAGTWHLQLRGTKVWKVRPCLGAKGAPWGDGTDVSTPSSTSSQHARNDGAVSETSGRGRAARASARSTSVNAEPNQATTATSSPASELIAVPAPRAIECRAGDLLLINTRTWWHCTELPPQRSYSQRGGVGHTAKRQKGNTFSASRSNMDHNEDAVYNTEDEDTLSLSIARDFNWKVQGKDADDDASNHVASNVDAVYCTGALSAGDVALMESELPDCALPRSDKPNCEVSCARTCAFLLQ